MILSTLYPVKLVENLCTIDGMANPYLDYYGLGDFFDVRMLPQLARDDDGVAQSSADFTIVSNLIDAAANEVETSLSGAYAAPIINSQGLVPSMMRRLVASKTVQMLYGRRIDAPDWAAKEEDWYDKKIEKIRNRLESFPLTSYVNGPMLEATHPPRGYGQVNSITSSAIGMWTPPSGSRNAAN